MTPALLRRVGEALNGPLWQSALARDLGVSGRSIRRWAAGEGPMPDTLSIDLFNLCLARETTLRELRDELVDL